MSTCAKTVRFDAASMWVGRSNGRVIGVRLAWVPRLLHTGAERRRNFEISRSGLHWEALDKDISVAGAVALAGDLMASTPFAA